MDGWNGSWLVDASSKGQCESEFLCECAADCIVRFIRGKVYTFERLTFTVSQNYLHRVVGTKGVCRNHR